MPTPTSLCMYRTLTIVFLFFLTLPAYAQTTPKVSSSFTVNGRVKAPKTFTLTDITELGVHHLGDVVITNHKGEVKGTAKDLSGVLLTGILNLIELDAESPKVYSEYSFVCYASDGYKVVFSWNELFNTNVGHSVYILTSKDHKNMSELDENILMISSQDKNTGRRYVKNLETIRVVRAQ
jgi:hypothetical protein